MHFEDHAEIHDEHPITGFMKGADEAWTAYEEGRSLTFRQTVTKYRRQYGRNPPPGFMDWYKFARDRHVHNIDDFQQIMDDIRPFWGMEPSMLRSWAAHLSEEESRGISGLHIRNKKIYKLTSANWRMDTFAIMVKQFVKYLPDMDIAMNRLDQPRVVVPWDDMQALLSIEASTRQIVPDSLSEWTYNMSGILDSWDNSTEMLDPEWFVAPGQQYMQLAKEACPPESHARNTSSSLASFESLYKDSRGGFITNFNRSSDLCTVGPEIENKHGFLFAPSTIVASKKLLPVFGECKVSVNSDILFPANMYYKDDLRYAYDSTYDYDWSDKLESMIWRGVTSGGTNTRENWKNMHRQRLAIITNTTMLGDSEVRIMGETAAVDGHYENFDHYQPSQFAKEHTDVGFTEAFACVPDCSFYEGVWTYKNLTSLSEQFMSKFVVDVDGHSFSGMYLPLSTPVKKSTKYKQVDGMPS